MAKQHKTSTGALIAIVGVVAILLAYILMENGGEPLDPASTAPVPADVSTELPEDAGEPTETIGMPASDAPAEVTAPAVSSEAVEAALADIDATLETDEYDASSVTELFEEDSTSDLTQPYEL